MASFDQLYEALGRGAAPAYARAVVAARGAGQPALQQGFATAEVILALGRTMQVGPRQRLLDLCCGPGEAAALLATRLGGTVYGMDLSLPALRLARARHRSAVRYVEGDALRAPFAPASFDAVLILDSLASIADRPAFFAGLARLLAPGGRFGCTVEAGEPLRPAELRQLPPGDPPCIEPADVFLAQLGEAGFLVRQVDDCTALYAQVARRLEEALAGARDALVAELEPSLVDDLIATMGAWADLFGHGRVAMLAVVAGQVAGYALAGLDRQGQAEGGALAGRGLDRQAAPVGGRDAVG
jgi:ubiquinone/menaquinone biosynthesis C-methylase UbiE